MASESFLTAGQALFVQAPTGEEMSNDVTFTMFAFRLVLTKVKDENPKLVDDGHHVSITMRRLEKQKLRQRADLGRTWFACVIDM